MGIIVEKLEKRYEASNGVTLTYLEDPYTVKNAAGERKLLVIFQPVGTEGKEDRFKFPYSLIDGLRYYNCRKIYIKDNFGELGSFYIGLNGSTNIYSAVQEFLMKKISEYKILKKDVTFYGGSKGGYASLAHGFDLGVGNIVSAIPQFKLFDYISRWKPIMFDVFPTAVNDSIKDYYNNFLKTKIVKGYNKPNVFIVTSRKDELFEDHVVPLIETLRESGCRPHVWENNEEYVLRHNKVVENSLNEILTMISMCLSDEKIRDFFQ
ncbi:hypothetical protein [Bacillus vallismortis]|uniref:hypothetical protein n=1 Tax=Bacillus vallismortis TaxID=72361 RepID=UPI0021481026|nr:hypothetical protein [Bacillus vallismortis]